MDDTVVNLARLVKQAQTGNRKAFGRIYDLLLDRVYRFIYFRVGTKEDAQDLTEVVFMKIWDGLKNYNLQTGIPFEAWVFRIARNSVVDYYRTTKHQEPLDQFLEFQDDSLSIEQAVEANLTYQQVLEAIKLLPDSYREIINLKFIEELENKEISIILDKPVDQIRVLQSRAIQALRKVLKNAEK